MLWQREVREERGSSRGLGRTGVSAAYVRTRMVTAKMKNSSGPSANLLSGKPLF